MSAAQERIKAISIRQPWAWLIVTGVKDIENRSWKTRHRGPIAIHASSNLDKDYIDNVRVELRRKLNIILPRFQVFAAQSGGIVGFASIVDCVEDHASPWKDDGSYGFVLSDASRCDLMPCRGSLGIFTVVMPE